MKPSYTYAATVVRIVDADTLDVDLDYGDRLHAIRRLRLQGVNAPEQATERGQLATAFVNVLLPVGTEVVVTTFKPDKYGRQLAVVHLPGGSDLATELLRRQYAEAYVGRS